MNRTLKRPMFRMGGSASSGITSGLDQPRKQYANGSEYDKALAIAKRGSADLEKFRGEQGAFNPMAGPGFLTSFGLDLMSRPSRGSGLTGLLATAAESAKDPFKTFQAAKMAERNRKATSAEDLFKSALASEYDLSEQALENQQEGDNRKTPEVEMKIIGDAQQAIFESNDIINSGTATIDEKKQARRVIQTNQNFLKKELGENAQYAAILGNEELYLEARSESVNKENSKRVKDYQRDNPDASPEEIQQNVKLVEDGTMEANKLAYRDLQVFNYGEANEFNEGGRVGLAFGGQPMMEEVAENPDQVQDLSYIQLRSRLPQEISNDIVQLLANSKQALTDFANIQTGEDIASFNQQYDVNLTLPQGA
tara:strand:- start:233 stop:1333 length:1101 start_codon:yes stop_codon:yes gene_type:complete